MNPSFLKDVKKIFILTGLSFYVGCNVTTTIPTTTSSSVIIAKTPTPLPLGVRAAQIIFNTNAQTQTGSFVSPSHNGTVASPGSGLQATVVFNPDGSYLGNNKAGTKTSNWPAWLISFELGISGTLNTAAPNPNCASFATISESSSNTCYPSIISYNTRIPSNCGAPAGYYRVSEVDCNSTTTSPGTGGPGDGIYFRAVFDRAQLGPYENILVTLQYSASSFNPAPINPVSCFNGAGVFSAESCSDFVWKAYLKHTTSETSMPFLMLIPPTFSSTYASYPSGVGSQNYLNARQFLLPLGADPTLSVLQISRTGGQLSQSNLNLKNYCAINGVPGNSPFCAGVVFYSITFYRM